MSVWKCCVPECTTKRNDEIPLHSFPNPQKDPERFCSWLNTIGGQVLTLDHQYIHKYRRVCHKHFEQRYFTWTKRLSRNSIPSLNLSGIDDDKNKYAPPCKKIKSNKQPEEQQTEPVEQYVNGEQRSKIEETNFGSPSHSQSDVPDHDPEPEPSLFSWQTSLPICVEKDDIISDTFQSAKEVPIVESDVENKSYNLKEIAKAPTKDNEDQEKEYVSEKHEEFSCDHCLGEIIGFRYTCVQCDNYDVCRACESQLVHPHHYMLRVPTPKPFNEIRSVITAIRVKLKLLEEAFKQNSDDWVDVVIKKEEDPLDMEENVPHSAMTELPDEESVVPNADMNVSQEVIKQDSRSPSKDVQDKNSHRSPSTSVAQSSMKKNNNGLKKCETLSGISDKDEIFVENDVTSKANLIFAREDPVTNINVKFVEQNTTTSNRDSRLDKENKYVSNKNVRLNLQQADSDISDLQASDDSTVNEMFEEYLDEIWLDESILAEDNTEKGKVTETESNEFISTEGNSQTDKGKESEETSPIEKPLETKENIKKYARSRMKESKILNYRMKEAIRSQEDIIQPSSMLPVGETDDVTVVRTNVNQSNVEKPYNYYYYTLLPKTDRYK